MRHGGLERLFSPQMRGLLGVGTTKSPTVLPPYCPTGATVPQPAPALGSRPLSPSFPPPQTGRPNRLSSDRAVCPALHCPDWSRSCCPFVLSSPAVPQSSVLSPQPQPRSQHHASLLHPDASILTVAPFLTYLYLCRDRWSLDVRTVVRNPSHPLLRRRFFPDRRLPACGCSTPASSRQSQESKSYPWHHQPLFPIPNSEACGPSVTKAIDGPPTRNRHARPLSSLAEAAVHRRPPRKEV